MLYPRKYAQNKAYIDSVMKNVFDGKYVIQGFL